MNVPALKTITEDLTVNKIEESNAYESFCLGRVFDSKRLKEGAFEKIQKMLHGIEIPEQLVENPEKVKRLISNLFTGLIKRKRQLDKAKEEYL